MKSAKKELFQTLLTIFVAVFVLLAVPTCVDFLHVGDYYAYVCRDDIQDCQKTIISMEKGSCSNLFGCQKTAWPKSFSVNSKRIVNEYENCTHLSKNKWSCYDSNQKISWEIEFSEVRKNPQKMKQWMKEKISFIAKIMGVLAVGISIPMLLYIRDKSKN